MKSMIVIENAYDVMPVTVYDMNGNNKWSSFTTTQELCVRMDKGVYIVKVGNSIAKVIVT